MKINDYFEELKFVYPIADYLNSGSKDKTIDLKSLSKILSLIDMETRLTEKFTGLLSHKYDQPVNNYILSTNFQALPRGDKETKSVTYIYAIVIYFAVTHLDFFKNGFYKEFTGIYGADRYKISVIHKPKRINAELEPICETLESLIFCFLSGQLDL